MIEGDGGRELIERDREHALFRSWETNAVAWTEAVREDRITSRQAGTNAAIIEAILALKPRRVLDVGCGEGWLVRELDGRGIQAVGIDGSAPLIEQAAAHGGAFRVLPYDTISADPATLNGPYDVVVCNFALLGARLTPLLAALRTCISPQGALVIQTVHPFTACGSDPYRDGWRTETFANFGTTFRDPMPWYFRTIGSWLATLHDAGWAARHAIEPLDPQSGRPLSLLLVCGGAAHGAG